MNRIDMYWVGCKLGDLDLGSLAIEPRLHNPTEFFIYRNWNKIGNGFQEVVTRVRKWFKTTQAYKKQIEWTTNLANRIAKEYEEVCNGNNCNV